MSRYISYLNSAERILAEYDGCIPFASYLKNHFSKNKKYGSGDRKTIASLCYSYFRCSNFFNKELTKENILLAVFLCSEALTASIENLRPELIAHVNESISEKLKLIGIDKASTALFPWISELDDSIDKNAFCNAYLQQPAFFTRIRPGKQDLVFKKLKQAGVTWQQIDTDCLELNAGQKLDNIVAIDKDLVVQDYNSQKVVDYLKTGEDYYNTNYVHIWDCCAASGGKSILVNDILKGRCLLTVSDIRPTILQNLRKRLSNAGIRHSSFTSDLTRPVLLDKQFDIIICDAPCTGSGTWSRTPEQLYFFDPSSIHVFSDLQKKIVSNVAPHLKPGGLFFYITCSVFKIENQELTAFIRNQCGWELISSNNLYGYEYRADSMFVAVFRNTAI